MNFQKMICKTVLVFLGSAANICLTCVVLNIDKNAKCGRRNILQSFL